MIVIREFDPGDLTKLELQPMQAAEASAGSLYENGPAWTVSDGDGRILACMGFLIAGPSYRIAWALLALGKRNAMVAITRTIRRLLDGAGWARVEMLTRADFAEAADWAELLGFKLESVKRCALPDGGDVLVWARIGQGDG
jgi:hypothetical protein